MSQKKSSGVYFQRIQISGFVRKRMHPGNYQAMENPHFLIGSYIFIHG